MNPTNPKKPTILLTIDVEDWFQVENLRPWFPPATWDNQELRVEQNTHNILDLLDAIKLPKPNKPNEPNEPTNPNPTNPRATFFILGWIAKRCPHLVTEIANRGHEVASHGYNHLMCSQMTEAELSQDLQRSKKLLEDITGAEIKGYRAPNFSINDNAIKLVQAAGYKYDSSYNDFSKHGRYGTISINGNNLQETVSNSSFRRRPESRKPNNPTNPKNPIRITTNFTELKISNLKIANQIIPWGGGGYFRLLPSSIYNAGVRNTLKKNQIYMFYLHPWELDPQQPKVKSIGFKTWRHYLNLDKTQKRLHNLITTFNNCRFPTCSQYLQHYNE